MNNLSGIFRNTIPQMVAASEAAAEVIRLQRDLFLLDQELNSIRQIKQAVGLGVALLLFNLMLILCSFWVTMVFYEQGWKPSSLAVLCFFFFGFLIAITGFITYRLTRPRRYSPPANKKNFRPTAIKKNPEKTRPDSIHPHS